MSMKGLVAAGMMSMAMAAYAGPKTTATVVKPEQDAIVRIEAGMPVAGLEAFVLAQRQGESDFAKARLQKVYLQGSYGIGAAYQHIEAGKDGQYAGHDDFGIVVRAKGAPFGFKGGADVRYFPQHGEFELGAGAKKGKLYLEAIGGYSTESGKGALTSGAFVDAFKGKYADVSFGIEAKTSITDSGVKTQYVGFGVKIKR